MGKILLVGAGALACDLIELFGQDTFAGAYVDPQFFCTETVAGVQVHSDWRMAASATTHYLLAVSSIEHRERATAIASGAGLLPASPLVSPTARVSGTARLSAGSVVAHFSAVGPRADLGTHCLLMHGVVLGHDAVLEDDVVVCAGAAIGGRAAIGSRTFIGANAVLAPRVHLGSDCFVGAGAACLRDAPHKSLLIGNPARQRSYPGPT